MNDKDFFKNDPYRSLLHPILERCRTEVIDKAKIFYKKWKGDLRGWQHGICYAHSTHTTFEDLKGGFHFYVNPRYVSLKQLIKEIEKVGLKIVEKKATRAHAMRLFGDDSGPNKNDVFIRVKLT